MRQEYVTHPMVSGLRCYLLFMACTDIEVMMMMMFTVMSFWSSSFSGFSMRETQSLYLLSTLTSNYPCVYAETVLFILICFGV